MQSEQKKIGGFPYGDNSEKKLWSNLYRASYRGDRIKIVGEFADGNLPINEEGKIDWKMKDKNGVAAWKRVEFLDLQAPKNTTSASFLVSFLYFLILILLPGRYLSILSGVVSRKYLIFFLLTLQ